MTRIVTATYRYKRPPLRAVRVFFAVIVAASVLALGACNLDAYPCRGPYGEPCGGPRSGWLGGRTLGGRRNTLDIRTFDHYIA